MYRCPYCGSPLTSDDESHDGEALWCSFCGSRVEIFDAMEESQ